MEDSTGEVSKKLDEIARLLEDLLILEGFKMKLSLESIRAVAGVDKKRVNRISKMMKKG